MNDRTTGAKPDRRSRNTLRSIGLRICVPLAPKIFDLVSLRFVAQEVVRADRRFPVSARDIQHIGRLAQPRKTPAERAAQRLPPRDLRPPMGGSRPARAMMQVVRLDPA